MTEPTPEEIAEARAGTDVLLRERGKPTDQRELRPFDRFILRMEAQERGLLSCLREDLRGVGVLCLNAGLTARHFPNYGRIFDIAMALWREGTEFNILAFHEVSQLAYNAMYEGLPPIMAPQYIAALLDAEITRKLAELAKMITERGYAATAGAGSELLADVRAAVEPLGRATLERKEFPEFLGEVLAHIQSFSEENEHSVEFGVGLDTKAGPFCRGDLVIVAGATKAGKSALAGNIVENVAGAGGVVALFSLEMTGMQNVERMIASRGRVDIRSLKMRLRLRRGQPEMFTAQDDGDFRRISTAIGDMKAWKIEVIEQIGSVRDIVSEVMRIKYLHGKLDLVVVDYAQLVEGIRAKGDSREREVASISRELKMAAVKNNCVVLLLSQLNEDGRLRESRALGQDANCVLLLEDGDGDGMKLVVRAARSAPAGAEIPLSWRPAFTRFDEVAP